MGIYDRDYYQGDSPGQRYGGDRSMVTTLVAITAAVYLIDNLFGTPGWLEGYFALDAAKPFEVWRLVTSGFLHAPMTEGPGIWHIVGNMFVLWMFGREVEGVYGKKEFLWIYLTTMVFGAIVWLVLQGLLVESVEPPLVAPGVVVEPIRQVRWAYGASGAVTGIFLLFVLHFPKRKLQLLIFPVPLPAWLFGIVYIGIDMLGAMGVRGDGRANVAFSIHLAGAAFAFLYFRSGIRFTQFLGGTSSLLPKRRPNLRVHRGEEHASDLDRKADQILQKVHRDGADSITPAEKKILDAYSRRIRQKRSQ